jgi:fructose-bisphosphate aldolase class II
LVFHGGSGSSKQEYLDAIGYGVVKVNLDTDLQYAYLTGIRDYVMNKKDYLMQQVGNPDGEDKPNKKYFDPRKFTQQLTFELTNIFQVSGSVKERRLCPLV